MTYPRYAVRPALGVRVLSVVVIGIAPACSPNTQPASTSPRSAPAGATIMIDGHTHTISGAIECTTRPARPDATPPEYGNQTTNASAQDDSASLSFSFSDATPPDVNGFAVSLKAEGTLYQMPHQPVHSPSQLEATRTGKSFTVTGTGRAVMSGRSDNQVLRVNDLLFGAHITCP